MGGRGRENFKAFDEVGGSRDCLSISKTECRPLMEEMGTAYQEEAHIWEIKKLEVYGEIYEKAFS